MADPGDGILPCDGDAHPRLVMCGLPLTLFGRWSLLAGGSRGCGGAYPLGCEVIDGRVCGALP